MCLQVNHPHCCANSSLLSGPTARRGLRQRRCSPPLTPRVPRGGKRRRGGILVHRVALASRVASGDPVGLLVHFATHRLAEALVPDAESAKRMHANLAVRALVDVADGVAAAASHPAAAQPLGPRGSGGGERAALLRLSLPRPAARAHGDVLSGGAPGREGARFKSRVGLVGGASRGIGGGCGGIGGSCGIGCGGCGIGADCGGARSGARSSSSISSLDLANRLEFVEEGDACVAARAGGRSNAPEERQPAEGTGGLGSGSANDKAGVGHERR